MNAVVVGGRFKNDLNLRIKFTQFHIVLLKKVPEASEQGLLRHDYVHYLIAGKKMVLAAETARQLADALRCSVVRVAPAPIALT